MPGMDYLKISVLKMIVLALGTYNFYIRPNLSQLKLFKQFGVNKVKSKGWFRYMF